MYATFSFLKNDSGPDLITHDWVVLSTTLLLSTLTYKSSSIQNSLKAFRCHCSSSEESEIVHVPGMAVIAVSTVCMCAYASTRCLCCTWHSLQSISKTIWPHAFR